MFLNLTLFGGGGGSSTNSSSYTEVTHPAAKAKGHREYIDKKSGVRFRYDPARGKDPEHWHVENPNKTGNENMYLDKLGNPSTRHEPSSALTYEEFLNLIERLRGE